jgi:hypothetical protein
LQVTTSQRRAIPKIGGLENIKKSAQNNISGKENYFCMKKGRYRPLKAFRVGILSLQTGLKFFCCACGRPVEPVVQACMPVVEAFPKYILSKDKKIGHIFPQLATATCKHMCLYPFFTGSPEQCPKLLSEQQYASYNVPKTGDRISRISGSAMGP